MITRNPSLDRVLVLGLDLLATRRCSTSRLGNEHSRRQTAQDRLTRFHATWGCGQDQCTFEDHPARKMNAPQVRASPVLFAYSHTRHTGQNRAAHWVRSPAAGRAAHGAGPVPQRTCGGRIGRRGNVAFGCAGPSSAMRPAGLSGKLRHRRRGWPGDPFPGPLVARVASWSRCSPASSTAACGRSTAGRAAHHIPGSDRRCMAQRAAPASTA